MNAPTPDTTDKPVTDMATAPNDAAEDTTPHDSAENPDDTETSADTTQEDTQDQDAADDGGRQNREAAKYRRRLRAAEAERDQLAQKLEAMQRNEIDRQAEAAQLKPAALWASAALPDLLADDGAVDGDKVDAAITAARQALGVPQPKKHYVPREGQHVTTVAARTSVDGMVDAVMGHRTD
jgi:predicted acylesterase/phospholipase RssA